MNSPVDINRKADEYNNRRRLLDPLSWPEPEPIGDELLPVPRFKPDMLPDTLRDWVVDCAERMDRMPLDFPAVAIVTVIAGLVGRRLAIHPKRNDPWYVAPNLNGAVVGRPATKKSPALNETMRFIQVLEREAGKGHKLALADHEAALEVDKLHRKAMEADLKKAAKVDKEQAKTMLLAMSEDVTDPPPRPRYIVNDSTVEKLGELLQDNPNGLLLFRDELTGWLSALDRDDRQQDRAFFLEAWNGTGSFSWDRIGRGTVYVPSVCLSILGGIQPAKLTPYLRSMKQGTGDDGLLQRFQLLVWPDAGRPIHTDKEANQQAWNAITGLFEKLDELPPYVNEQATIRFDDDAQTLFDEWYSGMLSKEYEEPNPHIEAHLTKYHSLMPSLALIFHLIEGDGSAVGDIATTRAIVWCDYLEAHARRIYGLADDPYSGARHLITKLGSLPSPFEKGHFNNRGWSGLTRAADINFALATLEERGYIESLEIKTCTKPATHYYINPKLVASL
ncbi:YfjI family protein [bacterium]|nr:YfjI family protein [bacterium]